MLIEAQKQKTKKIILVAEDDSILRPLLVELLDEMQFEVIAAEDGTKAMALLQDLDCNHMHVDLLLTDIGLPGVNGNTLAEFARKIWPNLSILFITGYAHGINTMTFDNKIQLLTKPFSLGVLTKRIEELIS
ncbi:response regulator [Commensalibacter sp. M0402]|uniref:response regulator n=1 Tax=Commensalibacter TaxID=1079922 RepID=UPI0018DE797D|nr:MULTISPECIES: response regulator [Commensalibacter]MBI0082367.1 response regulator [Commensalibacter sp. W6292M3]MBI0087741.1 response regulator [Commensalibacter melissae]